MQECLRTANVSRENHAGQAAPAAQVLILILMGEAQRGAVGQWVGNVEQ
jgi:hypothetical protein